MKDKIRNLALNLIAPGIGQFGAGRWIRGSILFITGISCFLWFSWEALYPLFRIMRDAFNDQELEFKLFNFANIFLSLGVLVLIWAVSYADLLVLRDKKEKS